MSILPVIRISRFSLVAALAGCCIFACAPGSDWTGTPGPQVDRDPNDGKIDDIPAPSPGETLSSCINQNPADPNVVQNCLTQFGKTMADLQNPAGDVDGDGTANAMDADPFDPKISSSDQAGAAAGVPGSPNLGSMLGSLMALPMQGMMLMNSIYMMKMMFGGAMGMSGQSPVCVQQNGEGNAVLSDEVRLSGKAFTSGRESLTLHANHTYKWVRSVGSVEGSWGIAPAGGVVVMQPFVGKRCPEMYALNVEDAPCLEVPTGRGFPPPEGVEGSCITPLSGFNPLGGIPSCADKTGMTEITAASAKPDSIKSIYLAGTPMKGKGKGGLSAMYYSRNPGNRQTCNVFAPLRIDARALGKIAPPVQPAMPASQPGNQGDTGGQNDGGGIADQGQGL